MDLTCHCGNVQITTAAPPESLTQCNCSICNRYGALWGNYLPQQVEITSPQALVAYRRAEANIEFLHCANCGCVTHYRTTDKVLDNPTVGINFRMSAAAAIAEIQIRRFDGANSWTFLDPA